MRVWVALVVLLGGVCGLVSCGKRTPPGGVASKTWPSPMKAVVSIPPLKGLVEPLLPPGSTVTVLIKTGASEHGFEPTAGQVGEVINADLLVWIGGMEPAVDSLSKANPRPGRTDVRLADALGIEVHEHHHEDHGAGHADQHDEDEHGGEGDPHIWLDVQNAALIVRAVEAKVVAARPSDTAGGHPAHWKSVGVQTELETLDREYRIGLEPAKTRTIVVGHDAYSRLAKRYNLTTVAISGLTASEPTAGDLQRAKEAVRANGLKAVFSEPQLNPAAAKSIADETGVEVLTLDPLGDGDYFKMMRANLAAIRKALGVDQPPKEPPGK